MNKQTSSNLLCTVLIFSMTTMMSGCFGGKTATVHSVYLQRAETALARGVRAEQKGNYPESAAFLTEALTVSTTIEDYPVRITALINLARLSRLQHGLQLSDQYMEQVLLLVPSVPQLSAEAAHEKALLELAKGAPSAALGWAQKAVDAETGDQRGSRLNLVGRINLVLGNSAAADALARRALSENRTSGNAEEEANSLRIMGIVARFNGLYAESEKYLLEALTIDKRVGRSSKIATDLDELTVTSQTAGKLKQALLYSERAGDIYNAAGRTEPAVKNLTTRAAILDLLGESAKAETVRGAAKKLVVESLPQKH